MVLMLLIMSLSLAQADKKPPSATGNEDEQYPEDIDLLEEIIQSYYLLLDTESLVQQYPIINQEDNLIENDNPALSGFYQKLVELRSGQRQRVSILQIGDSHIQPGYFSGTARASLQRYFGNAGRGLVFPWKLAGTNQPDDIRITSTSAWKRSKEEIGMCGYGLRAKASGNLTIQTNNFFKTDNSFNAITLILKERQNTYGWQAQGLADEVSASTAAFADASIYQMTWTDPVNKVELDFQADNPADEAFLYGISLEKNQPGLLYHAVGTNGAGFDRFSQIAEFFTQFRLLNPDLIIISLGTNDAQGRFREDAFLKGLGHFMEALRKYNSAVPLLFTLPPDSYKKGKCNQDILKVCDLISRYARQQDIAFWNLQKVMGGDGSIAQWRTLGLARTDYKHFTPKGYMLMGQLFYQALIKGYKTYAER